MIVIERFLLKIENQEQVQMISVILKAIFRSFPLLYLLASQPTFTYSKSTIETLEKGVKYIKS